MMHTVSGLLVSDTSDSDMHSLRVCLGCVMAMVMVMVMTIVMVIVIVMVMMNAAVPVTMMRW